MTPLRFIILATLIYILYSLLFKQKSVQQQSHDDHQFVSRENRSHDILVEDPVCHTYVPKAHAISLRDTHQTIYFCSKKCYEAFLSRKEEEL